MKTSITLQRGFITFPRGFFETLLALASLGLVAFVVLAGYGLWWLVSHVRFIA